MSATAVICAIFLLTAFLILIVFAVAPQDSQGNMTQPAWIWTGNILCSLLLTTCLLAPIVYFTIDQPPAKVLES